MTTLFTHLSRTSFESTLFFKPALQNLQYFATFLPNHHLLNIPHPSTFRRRLRQAMYAELTHSWQSFPKGRFTYAILPQWTPRSFPYSSPSRHAECFRMSLAFQQNSTKVCLHNFNPRISPTCPHCRSSPETVRHILFSCPVFTSQRDRLMKSLRSQNPNINPTVSFLLTHPSSKAPVETFFKTIFKLPVLPIPTTQPSLRT